MNKIPNDMVEQITKTAIKMWEKKQKKNEQEKRDNYLFNTRLLIINYRKLKSHCEGIPNEITEIGDTLFDETMLSLDVLMREKAKTFKMMDYVDSMLIAYKEWADKQGFEAERRYKVLDRLYINPSGLSVTDLEELFNIGKSQVYRDRDNALRDLSIFLFGATVIDFKME